VELMVDQRAVLLLDEAHHLSERGVRDMKLLFDRLPAADVIACGAQDLPLVLAKVPELYNRVGTRVVVEAMPLLEAFRVLPEYHPLYQGAEQDLITHIDRSYAHGVWRNWHNFTVKADMIAKRIGATTLDENLVTLTFAGIGVSGQPPARRRGRKRSKAQ